MSIKKFASEGYNYLFDMETGFFVRWGKTQDDDPFLSPFGPELLDIEVSTICSRACSWCYKTNNTNGRNMGFETFKSILDKIPRILTQIAFGIGDLDGNPDLLKMLLYTRKSGYIPNITINGCKINKEWAEILSNICGSVAVSHYDDNDCYNAVKLLTDAGLKQVNIHKLVAKETYDSCFTLMRDMKTDERLQKLNAIVFLTLKPKGKRNIFHPPSLSEFRSIVDFALKNYINFGFDSCSANKFLACVKDHARYKEFKMMAEPCESTCFSMYINVDGKVYPCSFLEEGEGIDMLKIRDFIKEVWFSDMFRSFRDRLRETNRSCPHFKI